MTAWVSIHLWQEPQWNQRLSVSVSCIVFLFSYSLENNGAKFENRPFTCWCKLTQRNLKTLNHSSLLTMVQQTANDALSTWARQIQWKCSDLWSIVQDHIASVRTGLTKFVWPFQKSRVCPCQTYNLSSVGALNHGKIFVNHKCQSAWLLSIWLHVVVKIVLVLELAWLGWTYGCTNWAELGPGDATGSLT